MYIKVTIPRLIQLQKEVSSLKGAIQAQIDNGMETSARILGERIRPEMPFASGATRQRLKIKVGRAGNKVVAFVDTSEIDYWKPLDVGGRPHWPPPQPIEEWVAQKGWAALGTRENKSIAWGVSKKIAQRGTPAKHLTRKINRILADSRPTIRNIFDRRLRNIREKFFR